MKKKWLVLVMLSTLSFSLTGCNLVGNNNDLQSDNFVSDALEEYIRCHDPGLYKLLEVMRNA